MSDYNSVLPVIVVIAATVIFLIIVLKFDTLRIRSTIFGQKIDLEAARKERPKKPPKVINIEPVQPKQIENPPDG